MAVLQCCSCGFEGSIEELLLACPKCGQLLFFTYPEFDLRPPSIRLEERDLLARYQDFLPFQPPFSPISLGEGLTYLVRARLLETVLGISRLYLKNETCNPTFSFKDRGTVVGIHHALRLGISYVGAVSTGNMAISVAAYAAHFGLRCIILVPEYIEPAKLPPIAVHQPLLLSVKGDYSQIQLKTLELASKYGIYFINSVVPMRIEGQKTLAFELNEKIGLRGQDIIVIPVSSGGNIIALYKGLTELKKMGLLSDMPFIAGVQAKGCSPIAAAFNSKRTNVEPVEHINTLALGIANPNPMGGNTVLRLIRQYGGQIISVDDAEIFSAQKQLSQLSGLFIQPEGAIALAGLIVLKELGYVNQHSRCILILTGSGLHSPHSYLSASHEKKNIPVNEICLDCLESYLADYTHQK